MIQKLLLTRMFLQKENLDLAFKTGESVGITATLVSHFTHYTSVVFYRLSQNMFGQLAVSTGLITISFHVV